MVFSCVVPRCTNRQSSTNGISFFRFPKNRKKRRAWIKAVNRDKWEPTEYSRICSEHFEEGWHSEDREDVNYRPTIFKCKQEDRSADKLGRESQVSHSLIQHVQKEEWPSELYPDVLPDGSSDVSKSTPARLPPAQQAATDPPKKRRKRIKEQHTNSNNTIDNQTVGSHQTSAPSTESSHQNDTRNSSIADIPIEPCGVDMLVLAAENQTLREQLAKQVLQNEKLRRENASLRNLLCSKVSKMSTGKPCS